MMHPSPTGVFGELFPFPAKGHLVETGLSDEQDTEAQALLSAFLSGYYTRTETASLLAGKEPSIAEGGLAQSKVQGLAGDLAARATTASLASGLASKQDSIADGGLPQAKVAGLVADLGAKASYWKRASRI